jgi:hypothetical protein
MGFLAEDQLLAVEEGKLEAIAWTGAGTPSLTGASTPPRAGAVVCTNAGPNEIGAASGSSGSAGMQAARVFVAHLVLGAFASHAASIKLSRRNGNTRAGLFVRWAPRVPAAARARLIFAAVLTCIPSSLGRFRGRPARIGGGWAAWFKLNLA